MLVMPAVQWAVERQHNGRTWNRYRYYCADKAIAAHNRLPKQGNSVYSILLKYDGNGWETVETLELSR